MSAQAGGRRGGSDWRVLAAVGLGGAFGAAARFGIAQTVDIKPGTFPWGTFGINASGSFALGVLVAVVLRRFPASRYIRPFIGTGFIGALTTYSTFVVETDLLVKNGRWTVALAYVLASLVTGLLAAWLGLVLARPRGTLR